MSSNSVFKWFILGMMGLLCWGCHSEYNNHPAYDNLTYKQKIKLKQYVIQGKDLYEAHCQSCHQSDGTGLGKLIPSIAKSAYLENRKQEVSCIIRDGLKGPWQVGTVTYDGVMPPNNGLTNLEIAEIITFIGNSWDNKIGLVSFGEVETAILKCQ